MWNIVPFAGAGGKEADTQTHILAGQTNKAP